MFEVPSGYCYQNYRHNIHFNLIKSHLIIFASSDFPDVCLKESARNTLRIIQSACSDPANHPISLQRSLGIIQSACSDLWESSNQLAATSWNHPISLQRSLGIIHSACSDLWESSNQLAVSVISRNYPISLHYSYRIIQSTFSDLRESSDRR